MNVYWLKQFVLSVETPRDSPFPWGLRPASSSDTKPQGYPEGTAGLSVSYADKKHVLWEFMRGQFKGLEWTANTILRRSICAQMSPIPSRLSNVCIHQRDIFSTQIGPCFFLAYNLKWLPTASRNPLRPACKNLALGWPGAQPLSLFPKTHSVCPFPEAPPLCAGVARSLPCASLPCSRQGPVNSLGSA